MIIHNPGRLTVDPDNEPIYTRLVIVATRIAEASVTINELRLVVDTGKDLLFTFSPQMGGLVSNPAMISNQSFLQRKGRLGRVGPGKYIGLYDEVLLKTSKRRVDIEDQGIPPLDMLKWFHYMPIKEVIKHNAPVYIVNAQKDTWQYQLDILKMHKLLSENNKLTLKGLEALECSKAIHQGQLFPATMNSILGNGLCMAVGMMNAVRANVSNEYVELLKTLMYPPQDDEEAVDDEIEDCPCSLQYIDNTDTVDAKNTDNTEPVDIPLTWPGYNMLQRWVPIAMTAVDAFVNGYKQFIVEKTPTGYLGNLKHTYTIPGAPPDTDLAVAIELDGRCTDAGSVVVTRTLEQKFTEMRVDWEDATWAGKVFGLDRGVMVIQNFQDIYDEFENDTDDNKEIYGMMFYHAYRNCGLIHKYWKSLESWMDADFKEMKCKSKSKAFYEDVWAKATKKEQTLLINLIVSMSLPSPPIDKRRGFQWYKDWFQLVPKLDRDATTAKWTAAAKKKLHHTRFVHRCSSGVMYFMVTDDAILSLEELEKLR